jgi:osmotically-inducible protein OsmY
MKLKKLALRRPLLNFLTITASLFLILFALQSNINAQVAGDISDRAITDALETHLLLEESVPTHKIDITTIDGVVTLSGEVDNLVAKQRATEVATTLRGVRAVINNIVVDPRPRLDQQIKQDVNRALLEDPAVEVADLKISVKDGVVHLGGIVASRQEKNLAADVSAGITGVRDVNNQIAIEYSIERSDEEIEKDILRRLESDVWVDEGFIQVEVTDGEVVLAGTVGSLAEKRSARSDAWVIGVTEVYSEDLEVNWAFRDSLQRKRKYAPVDSDKLAQAVEDALFYDPRVDEDDVEVYVQDHTVTLSGTVNSLRGRKAAYSDAQNTTGVMRVYNHLRVRPNEIPENSVLEDRIRASFGRDPYVDLFEIRISVVNGKAFLDGRVNNSFESRRAENLASSVNGVVDVVNMIDYEYAYDPKPDWELAQDIRDMIFWNPLLTEQGLTIEVNDGVVRLDGEVDSWIEFFEAEEIAFKVGAKDVRNHLEISNLSLYRTPTERFMIGSDDL